MKLVIDEAGQLSETENVYICKKHKRKREGTMRQIRIQRGRRPR
jgi:hypothetical protein